MWLRISWKTLNPGRLRPARGPSKVHRAAAGTGVVAAKEERDHLLSSPYSAPVELAWAVSPGVFEVPCLCRRILLESQ